MEWSTATHRDDVKAATTPFVSQPPRQRICFSSSQDGHESAAPFPFRRRFSPTGLSWSLPHCILAYVSIRLGRGHMHATRTLTPIGECQAHVLLRPCDHAVREAQCTHCEHHNATLSEATFISPRLPFPVNSSLDSDGEDDPELAQYVYDAERQCTLKDPVVKSSDRHIYVE